MMKVAGLLTLLCSWSMAHGQQQEQKLAQAMKQNQAALQQYTWKSQTQIRKEGEIKATKLFSNRYSANGEVVQLLIEEQSARLPKFGIRGMVAKKKKEEATKLIDALQRFAKSYAELPPAKMQEFMKTAKVTLETNAPQPLLRLEATNVLQPRDSMVVWLDANTRRQRRIEINSTFDGSAVRIVTEFKDLPDGPTYLARSVVDYPQEELTLTMENFGYELLGEDE
jgi:outer membrane lipoprotein-sorting protein